MGTPRSNAEKKGHKHLAGQLSGLFHSETVALFSCQGIFLGAMGRQTKGFFFSSSFIFTSCLRAMFTALDRNIFSTTRRATLIGQLHCRITRLSPVRNVGIVLYSDPNLV